MKHILIINTTGLGDSLWGTPALRALKKSFPGAQLDFLVNAKWRSLFENNPNIDRLLGWSHRWYYYLPLGIRFAMNPFTYDAVLIFHSNRSIRHLLPFVHYSEIWYHQSFDWLSDSAKICLKNSVHGIQKRFDLIEKIGAKCDGSQMDIFLSHEDLEKTHAYLKDVGFLPSEYVYLNIGASLEIKQWAEDQFIELAQRIIEQTSLNIFLGGGAEDQIRSQNIAQHLDNSRVAATCDKPLLLNTGLLSQARLMVTTDTGPMHIGIALKIPMISLFGPTRASESGPYEVPDELCQIIQSPLAGTHGHNPDRVENFYFNPITVDMVWEGVKKELAI